MQYVAYTEYVPNGSVTFLQDGSPIPGCVRVPIVGRTFAKVAKCHAIYTATGTYNVQAELLGGAGKVQTSSDAFAEAIVPAGSTAPTPTTATLKSARNPIAGGSTVDLTVKITPPPDGGTVTFQEDGTDLMAVSGPYCYETGLSVKGKTGCSVLVLGSAGTERVPLSVVYTGDANYGSSSTVIWETVVG